MMGPKMKPMEYAENNNENPSATFVSSHVSATMILATTTKPIYKEQMFLSGAVTTLIYVEEPIILIK